MAKMSLTNTNNIRYNNSMGILNKKEAEEKEEQLRKDNPMLMEAWNEYQLCLNMVDHD